MNHSICSSVYIIIILSICSISKGYAQLEVPPDIRWLRAYSAAQGNGVVGQFYDVYRTPDGLAVSGMAGANGGARSWVILTDMEGEVQLDRLYVNPELEAAQFYGRSIIQTDDNGFLIGINSFFNGAGNFDMMKIEGDGELAWYRTICNYRPMLTGCYAVIELKSGTYCGAGMGRLGGGPIARAFATVITNDPEEEPVWATDFPAGFFRAVREVPDEGLLFCGFTNRMLLKTDFNGEQLWIQNYDSGALHTLVSHPEGGYAAAGTYQGGFGLLRVNHDGERLWDGSYQFENVNNQAAQSLAVMRDGGFVLGGNFVREDRQPVGAVVRTDWQGNLLWQLRLDDLPAPYEEYLIEFIEAVLVERDGSVIMAGTSVRLNEQLEPIREGVLLILEPDRSPPVFVEWTPAELEFETLQGDTIHFEVRVEDAQQDEINYLWTMNGDTIAADSSVDITFDQMGAASVMCKVSDGFFADSLIWNVLVTDFYISDYAPDSLQMSVRRNTDISFRIETRSLAGDPVRYSWLVDNEVVGETDTVALNFAIGRNRIVSAGAFQNEREDWQQWSISVISAIGNYFPNTTSLTVLTDTTLDFWIEPFNLESDSVGYVWLNNGDTVSFEQSYQHQFDSSGQHWITAYLFDGSDGDSVIWSVDVREPIEVNPPATRLPFAMRLDAFPNPFNSSTTINYSLPKPGRYALDVVDIRGRLIVRLSYGWKEAGSYREVLNSGRLTSGQYVVRLNKSGQNFTEKIILIK